MNRGKQRGAQSSHKEARVGGPKNTKQGVSGAERGPPGAGRGGGLLEEAEGSWGSGGVIAA